MPRFPGQFVATALLFASTGQLAVSHRFDPKFRTDMDNRPHVLRQFFAGRKSPLAAYASEFVRVADQHRLDWRMLPAIATAESSAGLNYRNNNVFGWGNGNTRFRSVGDGIRVVAQRLGNSPSYRARSTTQKLRAYNPGNPRYARAILDLMDAIDAPAPELVN